ncbi:4-hydroxy-tetrahydrodipicolinate synthase [Candidatus Woesearchaeota archaeon]|nr:4-hydroxy-tetrahydrodipicolinate synthase [Candidatus Woesearchaeota archaeon]
MKNQAIQAEELQGNYTALITTMDERGRIDYNKLDMLTDDQIAAGAGILACGTTAQSATLSPEEHVGLAEHIFNYVGGRTRVMVSAGSNNTREAIELSIEIEKRIGATTFLHVTGYYNNPPQEGLLAHYRTVANAIRPDSNIILYNVPGRTKSNIEAETAIELAEHPKIIGVKEASGNLEQVTKIIEGTDPNQFRVMSGEDDLVAKIVEMGGFGVISATSNAAPVYFSKMAKTALEGRYEEAARMQEFINPLVKAVFCAKNPIPLAHMFDTNVRLPLVKLPKIEEKVMRTLLSYSMKDLGFCISKYHRIKEKV